ncbi:MAG: hypothetical protein O3A00_24745 [Planctomycetota bacterium]|nr:hypothetical protein [Planctomycetota bacterium]
MAKSESDREDLMREATALVERIEFRISDEAQPIVAGFRRDGRFSIYFDADLVYHFDEQHRLRRAFVDGDLYRTQGTTLARLRRERTQSQTVLRSHDLSADELADFRTALMNRLQPI